MIFALGLTWGGLTAPVAAQTPEEVVSIIRDAADAHGISGDWLVSVARCESTFNPRAIGRLGELGLFQLRAGGLLDQGPSSFYALGYSDPFNAWQAAEYAARAFALGLSSHWTCARAGR